MQRNSVNKPKSGETAIPITTDPSAKKSPTTSKRKQVLYRVNEIAGPNGLFPISKSSWWAGVKTGLYPQPVRMGERITAWRAEDLEQLAQYGIDGEPFTAKPSPNNGE